MTLKIFLTLILFSSLSLIITSCGDEGKGTTRISRGRGGGGNPQKPDEQAIQRALKDNVLLLIKKESKLDSLNSETVVVSTSLNINTKKDFSWRPTFPLKIGQSLKEAIVCSPEYCDLGNKNLSLSVWEATRKAKNSSKDDRGFLGFSFRLMLEDQESEEIKKSFLVVLMDLNKAGSKAFIKTEVIYPTDKFSLDEWIEKHTKQP